MYEQHIREDILFCMFYAGVTVMYIIASCYLLFRRGNAFAPDVVTSVRLRRWTAALFIAIAVSHVWYLPILYCTTVDDVMKGYLMGGLLDSMTVLPLAIIVLLSMLQDRKRPLWPVAVVILPLVAIMAVSVVRGSDSLMPVLYIYLLLFGIGFTIYMIYSINQYSHWLRDNYADLEHKEVRQGFVVLVAILLFFSFYTSNVGGVVYRYIIQINEVILMCYLLWRVETLSDLSSQQSLTMFAEEETATPDEVVTGVGLSSYVHDSITPLLQEHCIDAQLYLQHDLTLQQLAKVVGINRYYLSQYFSSQGTTYNAYVNGLRINHFVKLYHEYIANNRSFTTKQLANDSGYRSYSTFSLAFKQLMGQNVTTWMNDSAK